MLPNKHQRVNWNGTWIQWKSFCKNTFPGQGPSAMIKIQTYVGYSLNYKIPTNKSTGLVKSHILFASLRLDMHYVYPLSIHMVFHIVRPYNLLTSIEAVRVTSPVWRRIVSTTAAAIVILESTIRSFVLARQCPYFDGRTINVCDNQLDTREGAMGTMLPKFRNLFRETYW